MVSALPEAGCGVSAPIHLISFKLFHLSGCNFAVALRKSEALLLSEGQFSFLLCGGISALIFCHQSLLMGWFFYCFKLPVLSYLMGILNLSSSRQSSRKQQQDAAWLACSGAPRIITVQTSKQTLVLCMPVLFWENWDGSRASQQSYVPVIPTETPVKILRCYHFSFESMKWITWLFFLLQFSEKSIVQVKWVSVSIHQSVWHHCYHLLQRWADCFSSLLLNFSSPHVPYLLFRVKQRFLESIFLFVYSGWWK